MGNTHTFTVVTDDGSEYERDNIQVQLLNKAGRYITSSTSSSPGHRALIWYKGFQHEFSTITLDHISHRIDITSHAKQICIVMWLEQRPPPQAHEKALLDSPHPCVCFNPRIYICDQTSMEGSSYKDKRDKLLYNLFNQPAESFVRGHGAIFGTFEIVNQYINWNSWRLFAPIEITGEVMTTEYNTLMQRLVYGTLNAWLLNWKGGSYANRDRTKDFVFSLSEITGNPYYNCYDSLASKL